MGVGGKNWMKLIRKLKSDVELCKCSSTDHKLCVCVCVCVGGGGGGL